MTVETQEKRSFQAEVSRLLDIVAHSLYSDRRIFLRELISNASDACDRLRYEAITRPELTDDGANFRVTLSVNKAARTLTVADNGIGMNHDDLVENLGTIARSGTAAFVQNLTGDAKKDMALIGQFGVGFYSSFMVAERVEVTTRKAGETEAWRWVSDGNGEYTITPAERAGRGTEIVLHLRADADEFLDATALRATVRQYSDHIALPIVLLGEKEETLNRASALWMRPRNEVTQEQHKEFYAHVAHSFDEPWLTLHWRAEGKIEYTSLLYIPSSPPFDLYHPDRKHGVKLYVKRVFISDRADDLLPRYLRFLRGVVDSEDLPLNVSREMLQHNPVLALIRAGVVKRVLQELEKKAKGDATDYASFWGNFGPVLKEGLYEDPEHRDTLLALARFRTTSKPDEWTSLADYVGRMKQGQETIFYIAGEDAKSLAASPQLEGYTKRGVEVLLLTDPIDEFWINAVGKYQDKPFKSVTRGGADLSKIPLPEGEAKKEEAAQPADISALIALLRLSLKDEVKDVRASQRLTDSAVCLVADEHDLDIHIERLLRQHKQLDKQSKRILEVNPDHPLVKALAAEVPKPGSADRLGDIARLLLDQARITEGDPLPDPAGFARRMNAALVKALAP
ncbi:MAG TPA: molecular chaperone HtpG [Alphaproteobacteria bacterium]|nr:molecular chaperone HtpG [Alphaproteobacteria bacterium]